MFRLDIKRVIMRRLVMGIADGKVLRDGEVVFEANDIRVGLFTADEFNHHASCCNHRNGIAPSIGNNVGEVIASLRNGTSGIVAAPEYTELGFRSQVHGKAKLDVTEHIDANSCALWVRGRLTQ